MQTRPQTRIKSALPVCPSLFSILHLPVSIADARTAWSRLVPVNIALRKESFFRHHRSFPRHQRLPRFSKEFKAIQSNSNQNKKSPAIGVYRRPSVVNPLSLIRTKPSQTEVNRTKIKFCSYLQLSAPICTKLKNSAVAAANCLLNAEHLPSRAQLRPTETNCDDFRRITTNCDQLHPPHPPPLTTHCF